MSIRLQSGKMGELAAERFFSNHRWHMTRTQPPVTILGIVTPAMVAVIKRFIPRLAAFGHMVIARMGKGGVADYTGYAINKHYADVGDHIIPVYVACEVKEAHGDSMPASRLDKDQRDFLAGLPAGSAWVGIFWTDCQKFSMHEFVEKGSYQRPSP